MANSNVPITPGAGTGIDTFTMASGDHRQAVVIGDSANEGAAVNVADVAAIPGATQNGARALWAGDAMATNDNAIQLATHKFIVKPAAAAVTTNTIAYRAALWHTAASTKTVRIRAIETNIAVSATAQSLSFEVHYITAAPTAGTALAGGTRGAAASLYPTDPADAASEAQGMYATTTTNLTLTSGGIAVTSFIAASNTAALHGGGAMVYNWLGGRFTKPLTLNAGVLSGFAFGLLSSAAPTLTPTIEVTYTEE